MTTKPTTGRPSPLKTEEEAARQLGLKPATLRKRRSMGTLKLRYSRDGRAIRYRQSDIDEYIARNLVEPTAGEGSSDAA